MRILVLVAAWLVVCAAGSRGEDEAANRAGKTDRSPVDPELRAAAQRELAAEAAEAKPPRAAKKIAAKGAKKPASKSGISAKIAATGERLFKRADPNKDEALDDGELEQAGPWIDTALEQLIRNGAIGGRQTLRPVRPPKVDPAAETIDREQFVASFCARAQQMDQEIRLTRAQQAYQRRVAAARRAQAEANARAATRGQPGRTYQESNVDSWDDRSLGLWDRRNLRDYTPRVEIMRPQVELHRKREERKRGPIGSNPYPVNPR